MEKELEEDTGSLDIMNVKTLIDVAFGDTEQNRVNFKLVQTVLYLLARQLRILDRRVALECPFAEMLDKTHSNLKVTEVKIHATQPKKKGLRKGSDKRMSIDSLDYKDKEKDKTTDKDYDKGKGRDKTTDKDYDKGKDRDKTTDKDYKGKDREKTTDKDYKGKDKDTNKEMKGAGSKDKFRDQQTLEQYIDMKEKVLRVINQRADSTQGPDLQPKQMSSVHTIETQHEKLLIVERITSGSNRGSRTSKLSVATKEEFMKLTNVVKSLQAQLLPEDTKLLDNLKKTASLTDGVAALQLSARLESAEKLLGAMTNILAAIVKATPGMHVDSATRVLLGIAKSLPALTMGTAVTTGRPSVEIPMETVHSTTEPGTSVEKTDSDEDLPDNLVKPQELDTSVRNLKSYLMKSLKDMSSKNTIDAQNALKKVMELETKMIVSASVAPRMAALEEAVNAYAAQITDLDTELSSQMANYQELLTQMQQQLEIGLDAMAEAMTNTGGDPVAMAELNGCFVNLQMDFDHMTFRQKHINDSVDLLKLNIADLWEQIEKLKETKSDREEISDALRDKAGIRDLNGLVPLDQFNAVRGDFEKRIQEAYNKFNNQEIIWQKAIEELLRELGEKGDLIQLNTLGDEIMKYLTAMRARIDVIENIVGEPKSAVTTKRLFRDTACICCSTPAAMDINPPMLLGSPDMSAEKKRGHADEDSKKISGDGDTRARPCYFGLPVQHSVDSRAHFCQRYCGGSHTLLPTGLPKVPPGIVLTPVRKEPATEFGIDSKLYRVDDAKPCGPCNMPRHPPSPNVKED